MQQGDVTLAEVVRIGKSHAGLMAAIVAATLLAVLAITTLPAEVYRAEARVAIQRSAAQELLGTGANSTASLSRALSNEIGFANSDQILSALDAKFGSVPDVIVSAEPTADELIFSAKAPSAIQAAEWANEWAEQYLLAKRSQALNSIDGATSQLRERLGEAEKLRQELLEPVASVQQEIVRANAEERLDLQFELTQLETEISTDLAILDGRVRTLSESITALEVNGELVLLGTAEIYQYAAVPLNSSNAPLLRNLALGLIVGSVLAALAAAIADNLDTGIHTSEDIMAAIGKPTLATVPRAPRRMSAAQLPLICLTDQTHPISNSYRRLRTAIQFSADNDQLRSILVTSAEQSEGKTTTAMSLAASFSKLHRNTAILDVDLRRPRIHKIIGIDIAPGLSDVLEGKASLSQIKGFPDPDNLDFVALPAGTPTASPADLLSSRRLTELLSAVTNAADLLVIDAPPILPVPDSLQLAPIVDGVLLVVRAGKTSVASLRLAASSIEQVGGTIIGTVLVGVKVSRRSYYYYSEDPEKRMAFARTGTGDSDLFAPPLELSEVVDSHSDAVAGEAHSVTANGSSESPKQSSASNGKKVVGPTRARYATSKAVRSRSAAKTSIANASAAKTTSAKPKPSKPHSRR